MLRSLLALQQTCAGGRRQWQGTIEAVFSLVNSYKYRVLIGQVYLFEDAELKTIYNLNDLVSEVEPEHDLIISDENVPEQTERKYLHKHSNIFHAIKYFL